MSTESTPIAIKVLKRMGIVFLYVLGVGFALLLFYLYVYWVIWRGGRWLISWLGALDFSDPLTGRIAGALVALVISTCGVILTIGIRRWFRAQELCRCIDLIEAHRVQIMKHPHDIVPNAVFSEDLKDLVRFVSPSVALRVISTARVCQRIYELGEADDDESRHKIESLIVKYLEKTSLQQVSKELRDTRSMLVLPRTENLTEEELFNDTLIG